MLFLDLLHKRVVASLILALEELQVLSPVCDHLDEATAGVVILLVFLEMLGQIVDAGCEHHDLDIGRTGILVMYLRLLYDCLLFLGRKHCQNTIA